MLRSLICDYRQCLPVIGALAFDLFAQVFYLLPCLFSLTLTLAGTPPGPDGVVPLPAGLPLLASALAFGVIALRRKKAS